jgi:hypothetical protein
MDPSCNNVAPVSFTLNLTVVMAVIVSSQSQIYLYHPKPSPLNMRNRFQDVTLDTGHSHLQQSESFSPCTFCTN